MKEGTFESFWDDVLEKYLREIENTEHSRDYISICYNRKYLVYKYYEAKRVFIRNNYMKPKDGLALDRHKVASCLVYAILKARLIKIKRFTPDIPEFFLLINERLAFFVGLNAVEIFRNADGRPMEECNIRIPSTLCSENGNDFISNTLKNLSYISNIDHFDIFAYSTIFFLLEYSTDAVLTGT